MTNLTSRDSVNGVPAAPFKGSYKMKENLQRYSRGRLHRFGLDMTVIGVCFFLYYLGFFGGTEGPLNSSRIGEKLARLGATTDHVLIFFIGLAILAVSWNWIYNIVSYQRGRRLTCSQTDEDGVCCCAPVKRTPSVSKKTGAAVTRYVCAVGHRRSEAHFHPLVKGTIGHTLWVISVIFAVIVFYVSNY